MLLSVTPSAAERAPPRQSRPAAIRRMDLIDIVWLREGGWRLTILEVELSFAICGFKAQPMRVVL
jgi:hypothetical protein